MPSPPKGSLRSHSLFGIVETERSTIPRTTKRGHVDTFMGLPEHPSDSGSNDGHASLRQWEPDHEPPTGDTSCLPNGTCTKPFLATTRPALWPSSTTSVPSKALTPLNHHNQLTRFMAKQALGFIPKVTVCSPERTSVPSFQLPRLGTPPLSPQKWTGPSPSVSTQEDAEGTRPSLPSLGSSSSNFIQRSSSFSKNCVSPIPPLKLQHQETTHHTMSIADLCQPLQYMRAASCPSDTHQPRSNPTTPQPVVQKSWRPAIDTRRSYVRTQSCCGDADIVSPPPRRSSVIEDEENQPKRLERSSSMDAPTLMHHLKRTAAESIDLTQWLAHPCRNSLQSLADSADSMYQLEQAGRSMRISDSPRSDSMTPHEAKREKKLCAFPQCASNAVTRGLCISHGGGRRCQRKGCTRGAQSKGLCVAHGGGRMCRATGCSNIQRSMGLCIRHGGGRRCSVKGCQKGVVRQDLCTAHGGKRKCRVLDCTKHVKKKGLCRAHANSMYTPSSSQ